MKTSTGKRLKIIMSEKNLKQVDILRAAKRYEAEFDIKIKKSDLSQYVNDKVEPRQDKLSILAKTLNVNEAWLMGFDVNRDRAPDEASDMTQDGSLIKNIHETVLQLSKEKQADVYHYAKQNLKEQNTPKLVPNEKKDSEFSADSTLVVAAHIEGELTAEMREFIAEAKQDVLASKFKNHEEVRNE